jgi:hypothetical protein
VGRQRKRCSPFWESVCKVEARSIEKRIINMARKVTSEKSVSCSASPINRRIMLYLVTGDCNCRERVRRGVLGQGFLLRTNK